MEYQISYTSCADLSREIESQVRYIEGVQERLMNCKKYIDMLNSATKKKCDSDAMIRNIFHLNNYFDYEKGRYISIKNQFENYYHYVETTEESIAKTLEMHAYILSQQQNDETFLKARIEWLQVENSFTYTKKMLLKNGLSDQEVNELMALCTKEGQERMKKLAHCSNEELAAEKEKILHNSHPTLLDQIVDKILSQKEPRKVLSQLSQCLADDNFSGYIEQAILGVGKETMMNFQMVFQNMDTQSFVVSDDVMNVMKNEDLLKVSTDVNRQTCYQLFQKASHSIQVVNNAITKVYKVVDFESKVKKHYNEYAYYGADEFEACYGFVCDQVSSIAGSQLGKMAGSAIGTTVGTKLGGFLGIAGGPIGTVVGVVAGGVVGATLGVAISEVGKVAYDEVIEPARNWWKDTCNDIEDWWNMMWW